MAIASVQEAVISLYDAAWRVSEEELRREERERGGWMKEERPFPGRALTLSIPILEV
jgi:hypothetical protein